MNYDRRTMLAGGAIAGLAGALPLLAHAQGSSSAQPTSDVRQMDPNPVDPAVLAIANEIQALTTGPSPRFMEAARYFADDMVMQVGSFLPVFGGASCRAALPSFYKDGLRYRFDVYATQIIGPAVMFSRIDHVSKPGAPDRALPIVAIFTFRRKKLMHWLELPAYLNAEPARP